MQDMLAKAMLDIRPSQNNSPKKSLPILTLLFTQIITVMESNHMSKVVQDLADLSEKMSFFVLVRDAGPGH